MRIIAAKSKENKENKIGAEVGGRPALHAIQVLSSTLEKDI